MAELEFNVDNINVNDIVDDRYQIFGLESDEVNTKKRKLVSFQKWCDFLIDIEKKDYIEGEKFTSEELKVHIQMFASYLYGLSKPKKKEKGIKIH